MFSRLPRSSLSVDLKADSDTLGDQLAKVWLSVREKTVLWTSKKSVVIVSDTSFSECESAKKIKSDDRHMSESKRITLSCSDTLQIYHLTGGITNILYLICDTEMNVQLLMRVYGENTEVLIQRDFEERLFAELGNDVGFGPKLYALFKGGRFEEYYASAETVLRLEERKYWMQIAQTLCDMHSIHPLSFETDHKTAQLFPTLSKWLSIAECVEFDDSYQTKMADKGLKRSVELMKDVDFRVISERLKLMQGFVQQCIENCHKQLVLSEDCCLDTCDPKLLAQFLMTEAVFTHNDLLGGNILYLRDTKEIRFIDFEYGSYQYRCFDISNHFCEYPGFDCDWEMHYPDEKHMIEFLEAYLSRLEVSRTTTDESVCSSSSDDDTEEKTKDSVLSDISVASLKVFSDRGRSENDAQRYKAWIDECVELIKVFCVMDNYFWGLWAVVQAQYSPIDFDFCQYAHDRLVVGFNFCLSKLRDRSLARSWAEPISLQTED